MHRLHFNAHKVVVVSHRMCSDANRVFACVHLILFGVLVGGGGLQSWKIITESSLARKLCFHLEVVHTILVCLKKLVAKFSTT